MVVGGAVEGRGCRQTRFEMLLVTLHVFVICDGQTLVCL